jgi:glycosyltransferase involved in cell wall biosynthesis
MAPPRVSVVIPCYNLGAFLDEAIRSVLAQTYRAFEIIVVDDGSTDEQTRTLLDTLETGATSVIRSANLGLSAARNLGIRHAAGEYICTLDADDRLRPACLERSVALLDERRELAFVSHWVQAFGDDEFEWQPGTWARSRFVRFAQRLLARWLSALTGTTVTDPTSGFYALGPRALRLLVSHHPTGYPEPELAPLSQPEWPHSPRGARSCPAAPRRPDDAHAHPVDQRGRPRAARPPRRAAARRRRRTRT